MRAGQPSQTAQLSAMMRAAHPLIEPKPSIFIDELAATLCGLADDRAVIAAQSAFEHELARLSDADLARAWVRASRLSLAVRARHAEDSLREAMARGVSQYVILAAGYDSFAYCRCDPAWNLRIFEVDHPDTQLAKLSRLRALDLPIPENLIHVPLDFESQSLREQLGRHGFRADEPAAFCMLGVTLYLSDEAMLRVTREIATGAQGTELVVDYLLPEALLDNEARGIVRMVREIAGRRGEPANNCFDPARIGQLLSTAGFDEISHFDEHATNARYFADRSDDLQFPKLLYLTKARVARP